MWYLLFANTTFAYTRADTLRGSDGSGRKWWDVRHYDLSVKFDTATRSISGINKISFLVSEAPIDGLQLDLQDSMILDKVELDGKPINIIKDGNVWWVLYPFHDWKKGMNENIVAYFHGKPRVAKNPPWDGGFIWTKDDNNKLWLSVACQGIGASIWWPCKDAQWDEPEDGADVQYSVPAGMVCVSNGRLIKKENEKNNYTNWHWQVKNPINNYDITFYIGDYVRWSDTLMGEKGRLDLNFYALKDHEDKAREQFKEVKPMLHCFEYWMGAYPFYEDGYKLVEAPYLGMEHQGAVAYGNSFKMGYMGLDLSGTGVGLRFDYIIVHESGHEWFGNNITAKDIADNWVHEGITMYSETLYAECKLGKEDAYKYCRGEWKTIKNDRPVIGDYGVNNEGSEDEYAKGAAVMHMIRMITNDDEKFRGMLRGLNKTFYHQTVTTKQIEQYIDTYTGKNFDPLFNQYLRTTQIPELEYYIKDEKLYYRFTNIVDGFTLPLEVATDKETEKIDPTAEWQNISWEGGYDVSFSEDFLYTIKS
ncbi:MAG TPA: M1 family metallopeptidase [Flavipsychrobacter sp.]|nr:M1 family metallopeptidase [Flavipsychrobacter sp.]